MNTKTIEVRREKYDTRVFCSACGTVDKRHDRRDGIRLARDHNRLVHGEKFLISDDLGERISQYP